MNVVLVRWSGEPVELGGRDALGYVDDVRVIVRRNQIRDRWLCAEHGERTNLGHCPHTLALALTPAEPEKRNRA